MGCLKQNKTETIWYVSNKQNQMLKSLFGPKIDYFSPSEASPNRALYIELPLVFSFFLFYVHKIKLHFSRVLKGDEINILKLQKKFYVFVLCQTTHQR